MPYKDITAWDNFTISYDNATVSYVPIQAWSTFSTLNDYPIYVQANSDTCKEIEIKEEDLVNILGGEENDK